MASTLDFVNYVVEQLGDIGDISYKKMFGEYMVYINQKPVIMVCDNTAYVRKHDCIKHLCDGGEVGFPYHGAKEHYILDIDDSETLVKVILEVEKVVKIPIKKKKK